MPVGTRTDSGVIYKYCIFVDYRDSVELIQAGAFTKRGTFAT